MKMHGTSAIPLRGSLVASGAVRGLVRLVRCPGDHVFRNKERWTSQSRGVEEKCHTSGDDMDETVKRICQSVQARTCSEVAGSGSFSGKAWASFHEFWSRPHAIPVHVVRYEDFLSQAEETTRGLFDFMGIDAPHLQEAVAKIRPPTYDIGHELEVNCGMDVAIKVHENTKKYSDPLGYPFDLSTGHWSLGPLIQPASP